MFSKKEITTGSLAYFIKKDTTIEDFYNRITFEGTRFNYDLNMLTSRNSWSLLHIVCEAENVPLAKALINAGVYVNSVRSDYYTPLDQAIEAKNLELIQLLIERGGKANQNLSTAIKKINIQLENLNNNDLELKNKLIALKEYLSEDKNTSVFQPIPYLSMEETIKIFREAFHNNDVDCVDACLQSSPFFIRFVDVDCQSLTRKAAKNGQLEMVKLLVQYGREIIEGFDLGQEGVSTIELARKENHTEVADFLQKIQDDRYKCLKMAVEEELKQQNSFEYSI